MTNAPAAPATPASAPAAAPAAGSEAGIVELVRILQQVERPDLAKRASAAAARLKRPSTVVCVVGEFKQGKSSLVNGLLGRTICPVDDDLATSAITLVRYGDETTATVRRRGDDGATASQPVAVEDLPNWVSEAGNPRNSKQVERVEISVSSPLLKQGLVMVDTPGMGGLGAGHAAATLAFLPFADGLVFVSDASAELSAPEVEFLRRATELCPTVMFALTKIDLYPQWQRIADLNRGHLERQRLPVPMVAVSSVVRAEALARKDRELNEHSNFPVLVKELGDKVVTPAKAGAAKRSASEAAGIAAMVRSGLEAEKAVLGDPAATKAAMERLDVAKARLEHLRGPAARWSTIVGDRTADLSNSVMFEFRAGMRTISRNMDEVIEGLSKGETWDDMVHDLQADVADEVARAFLALEEGRLAIRDAVVETLGDEDLNIELGPSGDTNWLDVSDLWQGKALDAGGSGKKRAFDKGMVGLRGAQGGVMMFGMMGSFLPAAAGALLATNPVLLGIGALFGGMGLADDRKRKVQMRRQAARQQVRQFLDDVQFEVTNQLTSVTRDIQRELRDEFTERLGELQRTWTNTAKSAQEDAQRSQQERQKKGGELDQRIAALKKVEAVLGAAK
ncbi:dynamin family protein [Desertimonas flava]|uniref:dynamin family protein n=1 Tax=Desertimonas flava TaxID=2064846 RepID=UPI000E354314|nr:dynamin family protein [Desertimonas flava]